MQKNYSGNVNFYPRPPRGGRPYASLSDGRRWRFLSTPSARRATQGSAQSELLAQFLSTPSARRTTGPCKDALDKLEFLSTPSARRATSKAIDDYTMQLIISIHALREEGDPRRPRMHRWQRISIHALREEGDVAALRDAHDFTRFLSTPSARRATNRRYHNGRNFQNFYPRPPRGGRQQTFPLTTTTVQFLSTPSARRATLINGYATGTKGISIHALREEGDRFSVV